MRIPWKRGGSQERSTSGALRLGILPWRRGGLRWRSAHNGSPDLGWGPRLRFGRRASSVEVVTCQSLDGTEIPQILRTHRHFNRLPTSARIADLVLGVVRIDEVLHYAAAFEDVDFVSVGVSVCQGGNSAVGVDGRKPSGFLLVVRHVYLLHFVGV
jgi:hypothetical protein